MSRWDDEKIKVKDIFDTIRNFGLCGAVFYIGIYILTKPTSLKFLTYIDFFTGACIILLSVYLFYINYVSFQKIVLEENIAGNVGKIFYHMVPIIILLFGLNALVQTSYSIELKNGKKVSELRFKDLKDNEDSSQK